VLTKTITIFGKEQKMKSKCVFSVIVLFAFNICIFGGNLEPNAPPGSTMKPLDQVEPRIPITSVPITISESGSYYLTKNLTASGTAITVSADDVTIDLCGFTLTGPDSGNNCGVYIGGKKNVEIRNGIIRDFGYHGIMETSSFGNNNRIIGIRAISNGRHGIILYGNGHLVKDCLISGNAASLTSINYGIYTSDGCTIIGNTVCYQGNSGTGIVYGIRSGSGCTISNNMVYSNGNDAGDYIYGIYADSGSSIQGNTVYDNGDSKVWIDHVYGIYASQACTVSDNMVYSNGDSTEHAEHIYAVYADCQCLIRGNMIRGTGYTVPFSYGLYIEGACLVDLNHVSYCGTNLYEHGECGGSSIISANNYGIW
jgi:hypothetical protein